MKIAMSMVVASGAAYATWREDATAATTIIHLHQNVLKRWCIMPMCITVIENKVALFIRIISSFPIQFMFVACINICHPLNTHKPSPFVSVTITIWVSHQLHRIYTLFQYILKQYFLSSGKLSLRMWLKPRHTPAPLSHLFLFYCEPIIDTIIIDTSSVEKSIRNPIIH